MHKLLLKLRNISILTYFGIEILKNMIQMKGFYLEFTEISVITEILLRNL